MTRAIPFRQTQIFRFMSPDDVQLLGNKAVLVRKAKGDALVMYNESVMGVFVVAEGEVGVYPPMARRPIFTLGTGEAFGEMSFLDGSKASATIRVESEHAELAMLPQTALDEICKAHSEFAANLFKGIAVSVTEKLRATNNRIVNELTSTHKQILKVNTTSFDSGVNFIETLEQSTHTKMQQVSQALISLAKIAAHLGKTSRENVDELSQMSRQLDDISRDLDGNIQDFTSHMRVLHKFIESIEKSISTSVG